MDMDRNQFFISQIQESITPSTGCTEPVAIALCGAAARKKAPGRIQKVELSLDIGLFKNAMGVGIPGLPERGVPLACALGIVDGDPDDGMDILGKIRQPHQEEIKQVASLVEVSVLNDMTELFIQVTITTDQGGARAITYKAHDHIVSVETPPYSAWKPEGAAAAAPEVQKYTLSDFLDFARNVPEKDIRFLWEGVEMNRQVSDAGLEKGYLKGVPDLYDSASIMSIVQRTAGAASYARMSGVPLPTMTATGSGNQGITLSLTLDAACQYYHIEQETELRALALAHLVNVFAKSYVGALAAVCSCGIASGLGASVGIVFALGGGEAEMIGAMKNVLGSITGMVCDGAKEGCSNKVALAANCAVTSALMAVQQQTLSGSNGILAEDMNHLFQNIHSLLNCGMSNTNQAIVTIMMNK